MFAVFKGLELMQVATIPNALAHPPDTAAGDWCGDDSEYLVNTQNANGSWTGYSYWDDLAGDRLVHHHPAGHHPAGRGGITVPACACDGTGYNVVVTYSVERFTSTAP